MDEESELLFNEGWLEKWPKWLRYILAFPFSFLGCILSGCTIPYFVTWYIERDSLGYYMSFTFFKAISFSLVPLYFLYNMPPKHKLWFVLPYSILHVSSEIFELINNIYGYSDFQWVNLIKTIIIIIISSIYIKSEVIKEYKKNNIDETTNNQ